MNTQREWDWDYEPIPKEWGAAASTLAPLPERRTPDYLGCAALALCVIAGVALVGLGVGLLFAAAYDAARETKDAIGTALFWAFAGACAGVCIGRIWR